MNKLTLVIPAKNEAESLPLVLKELEKFDCKIMVVLQSEDLETINSISNYPVQIVKQTKNGYGAALTEGINNVTTEYFCIFNADGSFDPAYLKEMLAACKNNYDFVFASRYEKKGGSDDDTLLTFAGNKFFSLLGRILFSILLSDILFTYILGKTNSFKKLDIKSYDFRFCVELPIKIKRKELNYLSIPSYERKRFGGKKKVNEFKDGLLILISMLKYFFLNKN